MDRHYGMDWLRIGAFALLILFHVGMVFVPWPFVIKTAHPAEWVEIPMMFSTAWRLTLLFLVSGYASRALFGRMTGVGGFLSNRSARLIVPVVFAAIVIIPVQPWIELVTQHGYQAGFAGFATFMANDYFRFGTLDGIVMPTWQHLWFVVYLWVYTLALGLAALVIGHAPLQAMFDRMFGGGRSLAVPIGYLILFQVILFKRGIETHDLFNDGIAHLAFLAAFLFGFGLAGSASTMVALSRWWRVSAVLALAGYAIVAAIMLEVALPLPDAWLNSTFRLAREVQTWGSIAALIGIAHRFLNRDHRWRPMLTEAVFPFYIIHQSVIVIVAYALRPLALGAVVDFAILVMATIAGCWAFYLAGRRIGWLRPLIGLRPLPIKALAPAPVVATIGANTRRPCR